MAADDWMRSPRAWGIALLGLSVVIAVAAVIVSAIRPLTGVENTMLWVVALIASIAGSYLFSEQSAKAAAQDVLKPVARSAFRRVLNLYASMDRLARALIIHEIPTRRLNTSSPGNAQ